MKYAILALAMIVGGAVATESRAAQPANGQVSADTLAQLGLGGMTPVSDAQGQEIRGKGKLIIQANVLIVYAPSINAQANAIGGNAKALTVNLNIKIGGSKGGYGGGYPGGGF